MKKEIVVILILLLLVFGGGQVIGSVISKSSGDSPSNQSVWSGAEMIDDFDTDDSEKVSLKACELAQVEKNIAQLARDDRTEMDIRAALQDVVCVVCHEFDISNPPRVYIGEYASPYYDSQKNNLYINVNDNGIKSWEDLITLSAHLCYHSYQSHLIQLYDSLGDEDKKFDELFGEVQTYIKETRKLESAQCPGYNTQYEKDAYINSREIKKACIDAVNAYWGIEK